MSAAATDRRRRYTSRSETVGNPSALANPFQRRFIVHLTSISFLDRMTALRGAVRRRQANARRAMA